MESFHQIFDLKKELPSPVNEEQRELVSNLDQLCQKVYQVVNAKHEFPEDGLHHIMQLVGNVEHCAQAGAILGYTCLMLDEFSAMKDVFKNLRQQHGDLPCLMFFQALAEGKLGYRQEALDLLKAVIGSGIKHYEVFMRAASLQYQLELYTESVSMANLAVFENTEDRIEPFILLAKSFKALGQTNRMLECFSRIEKIQGESSLELVGDLYKQHQELYESVRDMLRKSS